MASAAVDERVRAAWQQQREGRNEAALDAFAQIVRDHPEDIDARYGLGLSQRSVGQDAEAVRSFRSALQLVEDGQRAEGKKHGSSGQERVRSPEDDRLMMLSRMLGQRIAETEGGG